MNPPLFGPPGASTNIALVDGTTYTNLAAAIGYFAGTSQQGGVVWDYDAFEDVATNPFPQNLAIKLFLGVGAHSSATNHPCGSTSVYCIVLERPWVLPAGTQIHGSGRVNQFNDPSTGTMFTIGNSFPAPLGPSSMPTATCLNTGGSLGTGPFYFVVAQYNNVNSNGSGQATPGVGLHSSEVSCSGTGGGSGSVSIPPPATLTNANGSATEWLVYGTAGFTGSVTTSAGATGGCPGNCVIWSSGGNFAQGQPLDIAAGVPIVISSTTYHIQQIWNSTTLSTLETLTTNSIPATYASSLGAWQQVCTNSSGSVCPIQNGTCSVANGSIDPTNCTIGSTVTVTGMPVGFEPPLPVDTSNCMFYMGGGNSSTIIFDTFMENFSINLTNADSSHLVVTGTNAALQVTPYTNSPACAFYVNTAQEEGYLREFSINGASQQSYGVFSNSAPNFSMEDAITGGGPNGYAGTVSCTAANPAVCTVSSPTDPVGNWWGVIINIAGATAPGCPSSLCQITTVNNPTQFTLTGQVKGGVALGPVAFCIGANQPLTACTGSGTTNGGNFIPFIFDGTVSPNVSGANGTARLLKNVSISSKAGAYNPYLVDIRGANASVLIAATHMEENPTTGSDCVYITGGANVTLKGDKLQCPNATVHRDATAGQGSVENTLNEIANAALFEDDQIAPGSGNGCGQNCLLKLPSTTAPPGSHSSYVNFSKLAAPVIAAWGFPKQGTPTAGHLQCVYSSQHVGDCSLPSSNFRAVGIGLGAENNTAQYQFAGLASVSSFASINWSQNDTICSDSSEAGYSIDNGAGLPCPAGSIQIGFVYFTDTGNPSSHLVMLTGFGTPGWPPNYVAPSMSPQTAAACTNVTNMTWNIVANKNYHLSCDIPITFVASATVAFCLGGPGSPSHYTLDAFGPIGLSGAYFDGEALGTTWGTKTATSGVPGAVTAVVHVSAGIQNGTTSSGTSLTLQTAADGTHSITVLQDAVCTLQPAS
jgi:hypothetical protein